MIYSSWLSSYRISRSVRGVPHSVYFLKHHRVIEMLLRMPETLPLIACDADNPHHIFGWCVSQVVNGVLCIHYLFVKEEYRKMGVAKRMVRQLLDQEAQEMPVIVYTHDTPDVFRSLGPQKERGYMGAQWVYDPYVIWQVLPSNWSGVG